MVKSVKEFFWFYDFWLKNDVVRIVVRPVVVYQSPLLRHLRVHPRPRIGRQNGEITNVHLCLNDKLNRLVEDTFIVVVKAKHKGPGDPYAIIMHFLYNINIG